MGPANYHKLYTPRGYTQYGTKQLGTYTYNGKKIICSKEGFLYAEILLKIMLFKTDDPFQ